MWITRYVFDASRMRTLVVALILALCLPAVTSFAQDADGPYTGKDSWKNRYVKRSAEIKKMKTSEPGRGPASVLSGQESVNAVTHTQGLIDQSPVREFDFERNADEEKKFKLEDYVQTSVTVLDPKNVSDIFGRRIAKRYVAFQVTISNMDKDHQFLLQDLGIDLSEVGDVEATSIPENYKPASNDITLLRGVSEKGQIYDWRNLILRGLRGAGTVAAGLIGVTTFGSSYAPGVAVFNGPFITSFRDVFPDHTVTQLNRLNDSAYQSNTIIPKQGSKVIVAFIDQSLLMDNELRKRFYSDPAALYPLLDFRKARGIPKGMLITDVLDLPPLISTVFIDEGQAINFTKKPVSVEGTIVGKNLTGARIELEDRPAGVEAKVKGVPESNRLNFTLTSNNPIAADTLLTFVIAKNDDVSKRDYRVPDRRKVPFLDKLDVKLKQGDADKEITLKGRDFMQFLFEVVSCGDRLKITEATWQSATEIKIKVTVPDDAQPGPCNIKVKNGDNFESDAQPITIEKK